MPILPRPVLPGQAVRADDYNKLLQFVQSLVVRQGVGIRLTQQTNGVIVSLQATPEAAVGGGSTTIVHPFQITDASDETAAKVNIRFGMLNNLTPTLDDGTTELTTLTEIALDPPATTGTWIIFMAVAIVDDDSVQVPDYDYVWIVAQKDWTEAGDGGDPALLGYQIIAEVDVVAGDAFADPPTVDHVTEIRQVVTHSLRHQICGRQVADEEADPPITFTPGYPTFWGV